MNDTLRRGGHPLPHDLPCFRCAHPAHSYLPCSDECNCTPEEMPGASPLDSPQRVRVLASVAA